MSQQVQPNFTLTFSNGSDGTPGLHEPLQPQHAAPLAGSQGEGELPKYEITKDLEDQLRKHRTKHPQGQQYFWPTAVWRALVIPISVIQELQNQCGFSEAEATRCSERMFQDEGVSLVRVFTIFLLINELRRETWEHVMGCTSPYKVRDDKLPLVLISDEGQHTVEDRDGQSKLCCFGKWKPHSLESFEIYQERLAVPFFSLSETHNRIIHQEFDTSTILPWCEEQGVNKLIGAMSGGVRFRDKSEDSSTLSQFSRFIESSMSPYYDTTTLAMSKIWEVIGLTQSSRPQDQCCRWIFRSQEAQEWIQGRLSTGGRCTGKIQWEGTQTHGHPPGNIHAE